MATLDSSAPRPLYLLPGLPTSPRGAVASMLLIAAVFLSRVLLLPDGPWEQDEALFASAVESFDVLRHRPHPPGFAGWIGVGKALALLTHDSLVALQLGSCIASTLLFIFAAQLLALWQGPASPRTATLAALAFSLTPLAWVHAPRAFSTTPALAGLAGALWLWTRRRPSAQLAGWAVLGLALTIRPQLAPEALVLALFGCTRTHVSAKLRVLGGLIAVTVVVAGVLATWASAPSTAHLVASFADHFGRHHGGMAQGLSWSALGVVRGIGDPVVAAIIAGLTVLGVVQRIRQHPRCGWWWLAVLAVTAWMLLRAHHPGFPRYTVALLAAALPFVVTSLGMLPARWRNGALAAACIAGALEALGSLLALHSSPLPAIAAVRLAADDPQATTLAFSHGLFSFARFEAERTGLATVDVLEAQSPPALASGSYALGGRTLHFVDGVTTCTVDVPPASRASMALSQQRFGTVRLARDPVLLGAGVHAPEQDAQGERFAWLSGQATLVAPAGAEVLVLQLHTPAAGGPQAVEVRGEHTLLDRHELPVGPSTLEVPLTSCDAGCPIHLRFAQTRFEGDDTRPLSVQLDAAWVRGPTYRPAAGRWSPGLPRSLRAADVRLAGMQPPERFGRRWGAWTGATAHASFPARPGTVTLQLARPQHTPGEVTVATDAETRTMELGAAVTRVTLRTEAPRGQATVSLASPTFAPAAVRPGSTDTRELGLIVYDVAFAPDGDACGTH